MRALYSYVILALWLLVSPANAAHTVFIESPSTTTTVTVTTTIPSTTSLPSVTSTTSTSSSTAASTTSTSSSTSTTLEPVALKMIFGPTDGHPWNLDFGNFPTANDALLCTEWIPSVGVSGADRVGWFKNSGSATVGLAIYNYDGTAQIMEANSTGDTVTGLTPFTIDPGTQYRVCMCVTDRTVALYTTGQNANFEFDNVGRFANLFLTKFGVAANSCSSGNPPATTGSLTPPSFVCSTTTCGSFPIDAYYSSNCGSNNWNCDGMFPIFSVGSSSP